MKNLANRLAHRIGAALFRPLAERILAQPEVFNEGPLRLWCGVCDIHGEVALRTAVLKQLAVQDNDIEWHPDVASEVTNPKLWRYLSDGQPAVVIVIAKAPILSHPAAPPGLDQGVDGPDVQNAVIAPNVGKVLAAESVPVAQQLTLAAVRRQRIHLVPFRGVVDEQQIPLLTG